MIIGPFQFWKTFRGKYIKTHRFLGRVYLIAILLGTISATNLAWTSGYKISFSWAFGLQALAFAWISTALMAYISVRRGRIMQHKEWMIRTYVLTANFIIFRLIFYGLLGIDGFPFKDDLGGFTAWAGWSIPLLFTEWILQATKIKRKHTRKAAQASL